MGDETHKLVLSWFGKMFWIMNFMWNLVESHVSSKYEDSQFSVWSYTLLLDILSFTYQWKDLYVSKTKKKTLIKLPAKKSISDFSRKEKYLKSFKTYHEENTLLIVPANKMTIPLYPWKKAIVIFSREKKAIVISPAKKKQL